MIVLRFNLIRDHIEKNKQTNKLRPL